jgi:hypothetical protein
MFSKIGANVCFAVATLLFVGSTFSTVGQAGPAPIPGCAAGCCTANKVAVACSVAGGCAGCTTYKCTRNGANATWYCDNI